MRLTTLLPAGYLAAITVLAAAPALAAPAAATAVLAAPARAERIMSPMGGWRCDATACTGPASTALGEAVAVCTSLADRAGRVSSFAVGPAAFAEAELARCNRHVKSQ